MGVKKATKWVEILKRKEGLVAIIGLAVGKGQGDDRGPGRG